MLNRQYSIEIVQKGVQMRNWNEKWNSDPLSCLSVYHLIIRDIAKEEEEEEDILHIPFSISFYVEK
jgi:hypothetical protein